MSDLAQHLNVEALNELKEVMGDEFSLLIDTFTSDSIVRIETINAAVAELSADDIRRTAHSFKGSASNMGATHLADLCRRLEELGADGQTEGAQSLAEQIMAEYGQVKAALAAL